MEPALEIADHEGVSGDARAGKVGESAREVVARARAEGLAGPKPDQRLGCEPLAHGVELRTQAMSGCERRAVEALAIDERPTPLAMTPKLNFADGTLGARKEIERFVEARRTVARVEQPARLVKSSSDTPAPPEQPRRPPGLGGVVDEQPERGHAVKLSPSACRGDAVG